MFYLRDGRWLLLRAAGLGCWSPNNKDSSVRASELAFLDMVHGRQRISTLSGS